MKIDDTLVDPHLESVPGLGALSARGFTGGDAKGLGGHTHWSLNGKILLLCRTNQISTHLFERADMVAGQGDSSEEKYFK